MKSLILLGFLISIGIFFGYYLIKYGVSKETFKMILSKAGIIFMLFWIYCCYMMMTYVEGVEKLAILPFVLCGFGAILMMYEKTRKVGYRIFMFSFFGGFGMLIILGLLNRH